MIRGSQNRSQAFVNRALLTEAVREVLLRSQCMTFNPNCKHDHGFRPQTLYIDGVAKTGWGCNLLCGYHLNFNPDDMSGVAILSEPSPNKDWKNSPKLDSHEVGK